MEKKRILFVTNHFRFSNGVASVLRSMIDNLDVDQYDISLLAIYEFNEEFARPIKDKVNIVKGLNFYFKGLDKVMNCIPLRWLYKYFIREQYDLEVAYQFGLPTKILSVSHNLNKICWMHTYDTEMLLKKYYVKFNQIITVAKVGREKLLKEGFLPAQCDYCYNVIDEDNILEKAKEEIDIVKFHKYSVVTVSRLMPDKACMRQLECILELHNMGVDAEFWIIGKGSELEKMKSFVEEHKMHSYAKLLGLQKNPYKYVSKADMYFCGSYREGYSTACQEAAIIGIPVISTDVDGAHELTELYGAGAVISNDKEAIISSMYSILNDDKTIEVWKETARVNKKLFYKKARIAKIESVLQFNLSS